MAGAELVDEAVDSVEDRVERVAIAAQDHPGGECPGALAVESVEGPVDDLARIGLALALSLDDPRDLGGDPLADQPGELALKAGRGSEMMEQVAVGLADPGTDRLQSHRLRPRFDQKGPRRLQRGGAAFFGGEAFTRY
jgi:hypothetical protein